MALKHWLQLRKAPETANIPIIIVSIVDQKQVGFALGAADYLIKPIRKPVLLETIRKHVPPATTTMTRRFCWLTMTPKLWSCWRRPCVQPDTRLRACKAERELWKCSLPNSSAQSCSIC